MSALVVALAATSVSELDSASIYHTDGRLMRVSPVYSASKRSVSVVLRPSLLHLCHYSLLPTYLQKRRMYMACVSIFIDGTWQMTSAQLTEIVVSVHSTLKLTTNDVFSPILGLQTTINFRCDHNRSVTPDEIREPVYHSDDELIVKINHGDTDCSNNCHYCCSHIIRQSDIKLLSSVRHPYNNGPQSTSKYIQAVWAELPMVSQVATEYRPQKNK